MIDSKVRQEPQAKITVVPKSSPAKVAMPPDTVPTEARIRERAYELYESRGREAGQDERDWLRAEREILKREQ